jgi:hypothetical protein
VGPGFQGSRSRYQAMTVAGPPRSSPGSATRLVGRRRRRIGCGSDWWRCSWTGLRVMVAPAEHVLVLKVLAAAEGDGQDIRVLASGLDRAARSAVKIADHVLGLCAEISAPRRLRSNQRPGRRRNGRQRPGARAPRRRDGCSGARLQAGLSVTVSPGATEPDDPRSYTEHERRHRVLTCGGRGRRR